MFLTRPQIVIIDDDSEDSDILSESLNALAMECKSFTSGEAALHFLENIQVPASLPSLILMDYNMPRFNGMEVLAMIKSNKIICEIPVIFYSTSITTLIQMKLKESGAFACYTKPSNFSDIKLHAKIFVHLACSFSKLAEQKKYDCYSR